MKSIVMEVFLMKDVSEVMVAMKLATKNYSEEAETISKDKRVEQLGLPHHHAWNAMLKAVGAKANEEENGRLAEYTQYAATYASGALNMLSKEVRYCRAQKCWERTLKRLEISIVPNSASDKIWETTVKPVLLREFQASERKGMAPPGDLETRIQTSLEGLGMSTAQTASASTE